MNGCEHLPVSEDSRSRLNRFGASIRRIRIKRFITTTPADSSPLWKRFAHDESIWCGKSCGCRSLNESYRKKIPCLCTMKERKSPGISGGGAGSGRSPLKSRIPVRATLISEKPKTPKNLGKPSSPRFNSSAKQRLKVIKSCLKTPGSVSRKTRKTTFSEPLETPSRTPYGGGSGRLSRPNVTPHPGKKKLSVTKESKSVATPSNRKLSIISYKSPLSVASWAPTSPSPQVVRLPSISRKPSLNESVKSSSHVFQTHSEGRGLSRSSFDVSVSTCTSRRSGISITTVAELSSPSGRASRTRESVSLWDVSSPKIDLSFSSSPRSGGSRGFDTPKSRTSNSSRLLEHGQTPSSSGRRSEMKFINSKVGSTPELIRSRTFRLEDYSPSPRRSTAEIGSIIKGEMSFDRSSRITDSVKRGLLDDRNASRSLSPREERKMRISSEPSLLFHTETERPSFIVLDDVTSQNERVLSNSSRSNYSTIRQRSLSAAELTPKKSESMISASTNRSREKVPPSRKSKNELSPSKNDDSVSSIYYQSKIDQSSPRPSVGPRELSGLGNAFHDSFFDGLGNLSSRRSRVHDSGKRSDSQDSGKRSVSKDSPSNKSGKHSKGGLSTTTCDSKRDVTVSDKSRAASLSSFKLDNLFTEQSPGSFSRRRSNESTAKNDSMSSKSRSTLNTSARDKSNCKTDPEGQHSSNPTAENSESMASVNRSRRSEKVSPIQKSKKEISPSKNDAASSIHNQSKNGLASPKPSASLREISGLGNAFRDSFFDGLDNLRSRRSRVHDSGKLSVSQDSRSNKSGKRSKSALSTTINPCDSLTRKDATASNKSRAASVSSLNLDNVFTEPSLGSPRGSRSNVSTAENDSPRSHTLSPSASEKCNSKTGLRGRLSRTGYEEVENQSMRRSRGESTKSTVSRSNRSINSSLAVTCDYLSQRDLTLSEKSFPVSFSSFKLGNLFAEPSKTSSESSKTGMNSSSAHSPKKSFKLDTTAKSASSKRKRVLTELSQLQNTFSDSFFDGMDTITSKRSRRTDAKPSSSVKSASKRSINSSLAVTHGSPTRRDLSSVSSGMKSSEATPGTLGSLVLNELFVEPSSINYSNITKSEFPSSTSFEFTPSSSESSKKRSSHVVTSTPLVRPTSRVLQNKSLNVIQSQKALKKSLGGKKSSLKTTTENKSASSRKSKRASQEKSASAQSQDQAAGPGTVTPPPPHTPPPIVHRTSKKEALSKLTPRPRLLWNSIDGLGTPTRAYVIRRKALTEKKKLQQSGKIFNRKINALCLEKSSKAANRLKLEPPKLFDKNKMAALLVCHKKKSPAKNPLESTPVRMTASSQISADTEEVKTAVSGKDTIKLEEERHMVEENDLVAALGLSRKSSLIAQQAQRPARRLRSHVNQSANLSGVRHLFQKQPEADYVSHVSDLKHALHIKPELSLDHVRGIKNALQLSPKCDFMNVSQMKRVFTTSPVVDYTDVSGVKKLFLSPSPSDAGIKELLPAGEILQPVHGETLNLQDSPKSSRKRKASSPERPDLSNPKLPKRRLRFAEKQSEVLSVEKKSARTLPSKEKEPATQMAELPKPKRGRTRKMANGVTDDVNSPPAKKGRTRDKNPEPNATVAFQEKKSTTTRPGKRKEIAMSPESDKASPVVRRTRRAGVKKTAKASPAKKKVASAPSTSSRTVTKSPPRKRAAASKPTTKSSKSSPAVTKATTRGAKKKISASPTVTKPVKPSVASKKAAKVVKSPVKERKVGTKRSAKSGPTSTPPKKKTKASSAAKKTTKASPAAKKTVKVSAAAKKTVKVSAAAKKTAKASPSVKKTAKASPPAKKTVKASSSVNKTAKASPPAKKAAKASSAKKTTKASPPAKKTVKASSPVKRTAKASPPSKKTAKASPSAKKTAKPSPPAKKATKGTVASKKAAKLLKTPESPVKRKNAAKTTSSAAKKSTAKSPASKKLTKATSADKRAPRAEPAAKTKAKVGRPKKRPSLVVRKRNA